MGDKCWCGKALQLTKAVDLPLDAPGAWYCPTHGVRYQVPPDGLVPLLVKAVRAMVNEPFTEAYNRAIAALSALDKAER